MNRPNPPLRRNRPQERKSAAAAGRHGTGRYTNGRRVSYATPRLRILDAGTLSPELRTAFDLRPGEPLGHRGSGAVPGKPSGWVIRGRFPGAGRTGPEGVSGGTID